MATTQYIGARYVPVFAEPAEWNDTRTYEPLTIVLHNGNSYTSKQAVPIGIDIDNDKFWVLSANYNAQVEAYRKETAKAVDTSEASLETAKDAVSKVEAEVTRATDAENTLTDNLANEVTRATDAENTLTDNLANEVTRATDAENTLTDNLANEVTRATAAEAKNALNKFRGGSIDLTLVGSCNTPKLQLTNYKPVSNWYIEAIGARDENTLVVTGIDSADAHHNFYSVIQLNTNTQTCYERTFDFSCHANSIYWDSEKNLYIVVGGNESNYNVVGLSETFNYVKSWTTFAYAIDRDPVTGKRYSIYGSDTSGSKSYLAELDSDFNRVKTYEMPYEDHIMGTWQSFRVVDGVFYLVMAEGVYIYTIEDGIIAAYNNPSNVELEGIAFANGGSFVVGNTIHNYGDSGFAVYKIGLNSQALGKPEGHMTLIPQYLNVNSDNTFWFQSGSKTLHTLSLSDPMLSAINAVTIKDIEYIFIKRLSSLKYIRAENSKVYLENMPDIEVDSVSSTIYANSIAGMLTLAFDSKTKNTVVMCNTYENSFTTIKFRKATSNVTWVADASFDVYRWSIEGSIESIIELFALKNPPSSGTVTNKKFVQYCIAKCMNRQSLRAVVAYNNAKWEVPLISTNTHRYTWYGSSYTPMGNAIVHFSYDNNSDIGIHTCTVDGNAATIDMIY